MADVVLEEVPDLCGILVFSDKPIDLPFTEVVVLTQPIVVLPWGKDRASPAEYFGFCLLRFALFPEMRHLLLPDVYDACLHRHPVMLV